LASAAAHAGGFTLHSPDIDPAKPLPVTYVFKGFGCEGGNQSPALQWSGAPAGTRSYALTIYDPDAPTGSGWWHWVVVNLPASASALLHGVGTPAGDVLPVGATQINTDFGLPGYGGPCPPVGDPPHRYIVTLHALKVEKLDLPANATAALAGFMINANAIDTASFEFRYGR
jgi:Raf kinase inhibitor-like YbhB/YbcL family protein